MGIKKLGNFVRERLSIHFDGEAFLPNDTLLIDGLGLCHWLAQGGGFYGQALTLGPNLGAYSALDALTRNTIASLRDAQLTLRVFMDGEAPSFSSSSFKDATLANRRY